MENLVPLGTGNSRFMKSNISPSTTLAQLISMLNNGTFPYDVGTINPAGISQQGTPLNKDTLLKDATAGLYGLGSDAVPDDVLAKIADLIDDVEAGVAGRARIATGSYVGTGTGGSSSPNTLTLPFVPKIWGIYARAVYSSDIISYIECQPGLGSMWPWGIDSDDFQANSGDSDLSWTITFNGSSCSWYCHSSSSTASRQMNLANSEYFYYAIA